MIFQNLFLKNNILYLLICHINIFKLLFFFYFGFEILCKYICVYSDKNLYHCSHIHIFIVLLLYELILDDKIWQVKESL